jgi:acyl-lipid omega-6 desaturase (Delta-12 desaturase)
MLAGKNLIIATKPFAKENRMKSWVYTLTSFLFLALAITAAVSPFPFIVRLFSSLLAAFLLVRVFAIYHDFLHKAILKNSKIAHILFTIYGYYTLNPPSIWKRSHDYHHKHNSKLYTSSIGSFPIITKQEFLALPKVERFKYLFIRHPLTIMFGYIFAFWWGMCMLSLIRNPSKHWDSVMALITHHGVGFLFFYFGGWPSFWLGFMIPAFVSSAMGSYLFYAQHNFPSSTFKEKEEWSYLDAALQSSSYMKMNPVMHWFTGNIGYHHIHHTNALIPFYRLPEVHQAFEEFKDAKTTSLNLTDIASCLSVKVWDPESMRMLALDEF